MVSTCLDYCYKMLKINLEDGIADVSMTSETGAPDMDNSVANTTILSGQSNASVNITALTDASQNASFNITGKLTQASIKLRVKLRWSSDQFHANEIVANRIAVGITEETHGEKVGLPMGRGLETDQIGWGKSQSRGSE